MKRLSLPVLAFLLVITVPSAYAATATEIVPAAAPRGARVIVAGSGLDAPALTVEFPTRGVATAPAAIVSRSATIVEAIVPAAAVNGSVRVLDGGTLVGSFAFTVTGDPNVTTVATLARLGSGGETLKGPFGNVLLPDGTIAVADAARHQIKRVAPNGTVSVLAGGLRGPEGVTYDATRTILYVADTDNHVVRAVSLDGVVTTLAGSGSRGDSDGTGAAAEFTLPAGIAVDATGNVYVADTVNHRIKQITPAGVVTTIAGTGRAGSNDGPAAQAQFRSPEGVAVALDGTIYIADTGNDRIRKIANGAVTTIAGGARPGFVNGPAAASSFSSPRGVAFDDVGNLLIADTKNHVIRKLTLEPGSETVTTLVGSGVAGDADGAAMQAQFRNPSGVSAGGAIFISDTSNHAVRIGYLATQITAIYPRRGRNAGGETVRVFGTGFVSGNTTVTFGGQPATSVTVVSSTMLLATVPATTGHQQIDVAVTTPSGTAALAGAYLTMAPPTITSVTPAFGPVAGGTVVTVGGTNFMSGETEVLFDSDVLSNATVLNATTIRLTTPPGAAGPVMLTVRTPGGQGTRASAFTYRAPPVIQSFSPGLGQGGTVVTILGQHFESSPSANTVRFGALLAQVTSATTTQLVVVAPASVQTGRISVTTSAGSAQSSTDFIAVTVTSVTVTPSSVSLQTGETRQLTAVATLSNGQTLDVTATGTWASANGNIASVSSSGLVRAGFRGKAAVSTTASGVSGSSLITVTVDESIPPDPAVVAPEPDPSTPSVSLADSVRFLYEGATPVQRGVAAGAIEERRIAVVRGRVLNPAAEPLSGVFIAIHDHPELGYTISRADGRFDLAVNGGAPLIVDYQKDGFLSSQRTVQPVWGGWVEAPEVMLVTLDANVTTVSMGSPVAMQVAQGTRVSDADGARTATLLFPAGTTASLSFADGTTQPLNALNIRATEYTVGVNGRRAMPGQLPASSGYTYAVELSADEAIAAGASEIQFSAPVPFYVDNFLDFPVGTIVPAGYYDRHQGAWLASENGVVLKILNVNGGTAAIDANGDGAADDSTALAARGITTAEQQRLATLYTAGKTLWRVPMTHFTPWDLNWPYGPPSGATGPGVPPPGSDPSLDDCAEACGSTISVENRILGESYDVAGTPFSMHYASNRVPGYVTGSSLEITVSKSSVPSSLKRIEMTISVGGKVERRTFAPSPNQKTTFTWDGQTAYGRTVRGKQPVEVKIDYVYPAVYQTPVSWDRAFAGLSGVPIGADRANMEISLGQEYTSTIGTIGPLDMRSIGFGGWSVNVHHTYDKGSGRIYLGDGGMQSAADGVIGTAAGKGCPDPCSYEWSGTGGPARDAVMPNPFDIMAAPNGSVYVSEYNGVRRIDPDGTLQLVHTNNAASSSPWHQFAVAPGGQMYAMRSYAIGKFDPAANTFTTFYDATRYRHPLTGRVIQPSAFDVGPDGALYFTDSNSHAVFRAGPNGGPPSLVAGKGCYSTNGGYCFGWSDGDGGPAVNAHVSRPLDVKVGKDGTVYIAEDHYRLRKVTPDGIIQPVAGRGCYRTGTGCYIIGTNGCDVTYPACFDHTGSIPQGTIPGDGDVATNAYLSQVGAIALGDDGSVYFQEWGYGFIKRVSPDGILSTVAGTGFPGYSGDDGPARAAQMSIPRGVSIDPKGNLYFADQGNHRVRKVALQVPKEDAGEMKIASRDGSELWVFDQDGRHLRTHNTLTGSVDYTFSYTGGYLTKIKEADGRETVITRSGALPSAIASPAGHRTTLTTNSDGYLESMSINGDTVRLGYQSGGLLTSYTDGRNRATTFTYDGVGRLEGEADAAGGSKTLSYSQSGKTITATMTTGLGRVTQNTIEERGDRSLFRTSRDPNGLITTVLKKLDGTSTINASDGSTMTVVESGGSRFGMTSPLFKSLAVRLPSGLTMNVTTSETATLENPDDPLSLANATWTSGINGRNATTTFEKSIGKMTRRTPAGREIVTYLDVSGRQRRREIPGLAPMEYVYDDAGNLTEVSQGSRRFIYGYDTKQQLTSMTDALQRTAQLEYDPLGRVTREVPPGAGSIDYGYDANGNLTSITPQGRAAYDFTYSGVDHPESTTVPGSGTVVHSYNIDRQPVSIRRRDSSSVSFSYDGGGRISTLTAGSDQFTFAYHATRGTLSSVTGPAGSVSYTYDGPFLTGATWAGAVNGSVSMAYDSSLRLSSENGFGFSYDNDGLLTQAGALTLQRHAQNGTVTGTTLAGVTDQYTRNEYGEITAYGATRGTDSLLTMNYALDAGGRITGITESIGGGAPSTRTFEYDSAGRLRRVLSGGTPVAEYFYDANGNRTEHRYVGGTSAGTYNDQDQLETYAGANYTYTANGELKTRELGGVTTTYEYDAMGTLKKVTSLGLAVEYVLDPNGNRIGKKLGGTLVQGFLYGRNLRIVAELDGAGAVVSRFVYGAHNHSPDYMVKGGVTYRIVHDHLGSPRLIVNTSNGSIAQQLRYDEFGRVLSDSNPGFQPFGFAGGLYDRDTGLVRFGARDYDAQTGRFTTQDPAGFGGGDTNLYAYVLNDPVNLIDPTGLGWEETVASFSAGLGDALLLGFGDDLREWTDKQFGWNGGALVDECSGAYSAGEWTGIVVSTVAGGAAGAGSRGLSMGMSRANAAFPRGIEWVERSHWIAKAKGTPLDGAWNMQKMWGTDHALADPSRYRFMRRWWKADNPLPGALSRQWRRIPDYVKGGAGGAAYGGAGAALSGGDCGCN